MAYNFGVDQNDVMLTLVSFASQHEFFNLLSISGAEAQGTLGWLAYAAGLIGFLLLVLMPASWSVKNVAAWFILFLIVLVRPLGEPLFFSNPDSDASVSMVDTTICTGNVLSGKECMETMEGINIEGLKAGEVAIANAPIEIDPAKNDPFKVFSPQAVIIDVINDLNYGISTQLNGLGPRVVDRQLAALETVRRNATGDTFSSYAIADFLASCGARNPDMARVASTPSAKVIERDPDLWQKMAKTPLVFADGVQMFKNYEAFRRNRASDVAIYPTLICAPGTCAEGGAINAFDIDKDPQLTKAQFEGMKAHSIFFNSAADFTRIAAPAQRTEEGDITKPSGTDAAAENISNSLTQLGEDAVRKIMGQKVTMVVPVNVKAALEGKSLSNAANLSAYNSLQEQVDAGMDKAFADADAAASVVAGILSSNHPCAGAAHLAGAVGGTTRARNTDSLLKGAAKFLGRASDWVSTTTCDAVVATAKFATRAVVSSVTHGILGQLANSLVGPTVEISNNGDEAAYIVTNCAQMHTIADKRHNAASANLDMFKKQLAELMEENKELLASQGFEGVEPGQQTALVLQTIIESQTKSCKGVQRCIQNKTGQLQEMARMSKELGLAADRAMAEIMVQQVAEPQYNNVTREIAKDLGQATAGLLVGLKAMIGGYGSGTYAEIMPRIVSFAVSLMIILTPLVFMIGLLVPTWSLGVLIMSIVVIAYFLLTKVVFAMISIVMGVYIAAGEAGVISHETSDFADLVVGAAYTSAFILTGLFMFSLKNPLAAIQQVAGSADKASTISGAEALGVAMGLIKGVKMIVGGPKAIAALGGKAAGAAAIAGSAAQSGAGFAGQASSFIGALAGSGGGSLKEAFTGAHNDTVQGAATRETLRLRSPEEAQAIAQRKFLKEDGAVIDDMLKNNGGGSLAVPQRTVVDRGGKKVPVEIDSIREALTDVFKKGGHDAGSAIRNMIAGATGADGKVDPSKFGSVDQQALKDHGAVRFNANADLMRQADPNIDFSDLERRKLGKLSEDQKTFVVQMHPGTGPSIFDS